MVDWDKILEDAKALNKQFYEQTRANYPQNMVTNQAVIMQKPLEEPPKEELIVPDIQQKWYHLQDVLSRKDELLEAILIQLQQMSQVMAQPPPDTEVIPPGLNPKLAEIIRINSDMRTSLEGLKFLTGQGTVPTPGTAVEIISTIPTYGIIIRAHATNNNSIYVGDKGVSSVTGLIMDPGDAVTVQSDGTKKSLWFDVATGGDGLSWFAQVR